MQGKANDPSCLCGVIPTPNSYRMSGLWSKAAGKNIEESISDSNPKGSVRKGKHSPVGLTNLGNTCYINSVLQCLFAIDDFKYTILGSFERRLQENDVFQSLKNIFLKMECGPQNYVDPEPLISALRLDRSIQQDGQEFMKLFLTLLERSFEGIPELEGKISKMFRGRVGYQTRCLTCQNLSESSYRFDDFSELDIPIKGYKNLDNSLGSLLSPEILDGDNQYYCEHCNTKRDATRQLVVKDLPPFLCLSLQRFVFDLKKMDRVKVSDKFSFPLELDSGTITHDYQECSKTIYDLEGILLHKGTSAQQGHYVAHVSVDVKGKSKGMWYRFDDTNVSKLESGSFGHADHGCRTKLPQEINAPIFHKENPEKVLSESQKSDQVVIDLSTDEILNTLPVQQENGKMEQQENGKEQEREAPPHVISSNAYLLVYKRRQSSRKRSEYDNTIKWIEKQRGIFAEEYKQDCERHERILAEMQRQVDTRKEIVKHAIEASKSLDCGDEGKFIVSNWLDVWANAEPKDPVPAADNSPLLCNHGQFDPARVKASKRLASAVYDQILESFGGGPTLALKDICKTCLLQQLNSVIVAEDVAINRELFLNVCHSLDIENKKTMEPSPNLEIRDGFYVGKHWLRNWKNRKGYSMGTTSPTTLLVCPHGLLSPEHPGKPSKRVLIPGDFWRYLKRSWIAQNAEKDRKLRFKEAETGQKRPGSEHMPSNANMNQQDGMKIEKEENNLDNSTHLDANNRLFEFSYACQECEECQRKLAEEMSIDEEVGLKREEEKSALKHLIPSHQDVSLEANVVYKMIPTQFLREWRSHMQGQAKGKMPPDTPELEPFMKSIACLSHASKDGIDRIAYSGPTVINRRGRWMATNDASCAFEIIKEPEWTKIWSIYGNDSIPFGSEGISVFLSMKDSVKNPAMCPPQESTKEDNCTVTAMHPNDAAPIHIGEHKSIANDISLSNMALVTSPDVCMECVHERHQAFHASLLHYDAKGIMIEIAPDEATAISETIEPEDIQMTLSGKMLNAWQIHNGTSNEYFVSTQERKSKRARKGRSSVTVDSSTSLRDVKLKIFEALGVHPKNIRAFAKGRELTDESKTMLHYEIIPMEEIRVIDTQEFDVNDIASLFPDMVDNPRNRDAGKEEGFTGTALVG